MKNDDATSLQSAKELAMRCTAMVLSVMMLTSACRAAEAPPPPQPVPQSSASQPSASDLYGQPAKPDPGPRARKMGSGGFNGGLATQNGVVTDGEGGPWLMVRPHATSRPTEKGAYLGLAVSSVPTVVRDQLNLKKNVGLVVNFIEKDSPAEAAGFKPSDILQKLDDQLLVNTQQFAVLVRIHDINQPVRFTIIRQARPMEISAKLVEKDLAMLDESGRAGSVDGPFERYMELQAEQRTKEALTRANEAASRANDAANRTIDQVRRQLEQMNRGNSSSRTFGLESKDDRHTFKISDTNGHRTLRASDNDGKMIYQGPIDTPEQLEKVPWEIRDKVKKLPMVWTLRGESTTQPSPVMPALPALPAIPAPPAPPASPYFAPRPGTPTATATDQPTY
jgi:PDZ domain